MVDSKHKRLSNGSTGIVERLTPFRPSHSCSCLVELIRRIYDTPDVTLTDSLR